MAETYSDGIPLGEIEPNDDGTQIWKRVRVVSGRGLWAYYVREESATNFVVADTIFNKHAPHFAGQLKTTHHGGHPENQWCMVYGWTEPPRERRIYVEDEDEGLPRLERRS